MSERLAAPVVVIGADNFIGRRVVRMLVETTGLRPIAAVRRAPKQALGIEARICNPHDAVSVAAAMAGAAYVVNCAAGGAETMLAAARHICGAAHPDVRRIIHFSSMAVYGPATGVIDETHPLNGTDWYGRARVESETIIRDYIKSGRDAVILRPGCIHGPGSEHWTGRIARLLRQRRIGDLGAAGDGVCNLIAVDDVAAAVAAALTKPAIVGETFNLADPEPGTWNQYFIALAHAIGATPVRRISGRWLRIERRLAMPLKLGEIAARPLKLAGVLPEPLTGSLLALWRQDIRLDHRRTDEKLAFRRTPTAKAIADAAAWAVAS